jgi:hypothetical protein
MNSSLKTTLALCFALGLTLHANAEHKETVEIPEDSHFYNPVIGTCHQTIQGPSTGDHATLIQDAIDTIASRGGGMLTIQAQGDNHAYVINREIQIKSGVHIRVDPEVVFTTTKPVKITLFSAGKQGTERVVNFSMSCTDRNDFFGFDFSGRTPGVQTGGAIAVSIGGARNFRISDIRITDNYTPYSSITVNLLELPDHRHLFAKDGIIEHIRGDKGHYGYGLIQCQAATNLLYRDLDGEGGAALRLETGAIGKANLADRTVRLDSIYGTRIRCINGQAALTLSPHTVNNGVVFIDHLTATSCEAGAIIANGFLSAKKGQCDKQGNAIDGYTYGYFDTHSVVSNLKVVYGTNAQLRGQRRMFVPFSQRNLICEEKNPDDESYNGPTVAGIVYFAKRGTDIAEGCYTIQLPGLTLENFPMVDGVMENKEMVVSPEDEFKDSADSGTKPGKKKKRAKGTE